jgi:GT2 family glycosyltransferase
MNGDTVVHRHEVVPDTWVSDEHVVSWFQRRHGREELLASSRSPAALQRGITVAVCTYKRAASVARFLDSLCKQDDIPDELIIIDASPDDGTESMLRARNDIDCLASDMLYVRVTGRLRGLTRQRNFALRWVRTDLVAFFDDDIVLSFDCLSQMQTVHRSHGEGVVGVGAYITNTVQRLDWVTRQQLFFGVIPDVQPGRYHRSGMNTSWRFLPPGTAEVEGDWLPGGATMWKTQIARDVGFREGFNGYAQGEDLEFSIRARKRGRLVLASRARLEHLHDPSGRPDHFRLGYMLIRNLFEVHRVAFPDRGWRDCCWFVYAWTLDTLFLARHLIFVGRIKATMQHIAGRLRAAADIVSEWLRPK